MSALRDYLTLTRMHLQMHRVDLPMIVILQVAFSAGFVLGFGFLIPGIDETAASYITIGTAAQNIVTVGAVMLPQMLSLGRYEGRLDYFLSLPVAREAYLAANVTLVAIYAFPGIIFALVIGWLRYDLSLDVDPLVIAVVPLALFSLAGIGIVMAMYMPGPESVNALTQLVIFYVIFFAPVLIPAEQLPGALQVTSKFFPPTYVADGLRATLTTLPDTHLALSLTMMAGFSAISLAASAYAIRRRV